TPPLTTIHQPKDELGELAIDVLIHRMAQPALQQQRLQLTPVLDPHSITPFIRSLMDASKAIQYRYLAQWRTGSEPSFPIQTLSV
ncbi:hypothetical protein MJL48_34590, partial [Salmonella enterica subsp. enterica serovar Kentucky]|nr:hypothetical protein [Salmonella enterica subsp. enterica serovar Kentucky]